MSLRSNTEYEYIWSSSHVSLCSHTGYEYIGSSSQADLNLMWVCVHRVTRYIYPHFNLILPSCESVFTYRLWTYQKLISGWSQPHVSLFSQSNQIYISQSDLNLMWACFHTVIRFIYLNLILPSCESAFTYRLWKYQKLISGWSQPHVSLWSQSNQIWISSSQSDLTYWLWI